MTLIIENRYSGLKHHAKVHSFRIITVILAWVLIAAESDFGRASGQWQTDTAWTNKLEETGVSPMAVTTVRRALLAGLADSLVGR